MPLRDESWSLIVHGGARAIPEHLRPECEEACLEAVAAGAAMLASGHTALDAAEAVTRLLEDAPQFNAGRGSVRNAAGEVEMDAAIMDGRTLAVGAVGAIRDIRYPISVARALLTEPPILLVGPGANAFAAKIEAAPALNDDFAVLSDELAAGDTVGCVARDMRGHLAASGSTGGIPGKMVGRIGDTPLPGCGLYADDEVGAVALSGDGECIARSLLAAQSLTALSRLAPRAAVHSAIQRLNRTGGEAGAILIDQAGNMGIAHNSPQFSVAIAANWMRRPRAASNARDLREWLT